MDIMTKIEKWFQLGAAALFVAFSLFNLVRCFLQCADLFYALCFTAMLLLSWAMFKVCYRELKEQRKKEETEREELENEEEEI